MMAQSLRVLGLTAVALFLSASAAQAQGKDKDKHKDKDNDRSANAAVHTAVDEHGRQIIVRNGDVRHDDDDRRNGDVYRNGAKVPPGLAKKPGQMPPGQYKKRYGVTQGVSTLSDIFGRRGYTVVRTEPFGTSQYVYYRYRDGSVRRALVSPGTDRLSFSNVPASILQAVLAQLY